MLLRYANNNNIKNLWQEFIIPMFKDKNRKPLHTQLGEIIALTAKTRYWPYNYFKYKAYLKKYDYKNLLGYLPGRIFDCLREDVLNDSEKSMFVQNKLFFNTHLKKAGLPCTKVIAVYNKQKGFRDSLGNTIGSPELNEILNKSFVIKPVHGTSQGHGVMFFDISLDKEKSYVIEGIKLDFANLCRYIDNACLFYHSDILIEERVNQHNGLDIFKSHSLNTIRIDTLITVDNNVLINGAALKIGRHNKQNDNWHGQSGCIAVKINLEKGELEEYGVDYFLKEYLVHPGTDIKYEGYKVPFWHELLVLVRKAAMLFDGVSSIGWDIGIAPEGPVFIEGNADYSLRFSQAVNGPYLENREFINEIKKHLERTVNKIRYEKYFICKHQLSNQRGHRVSS